MKSNQRIEWRGLLENLLSPSRLPTLLRKIRSRVLGRDSKRENAVAWARGHAVDLDETMNAIDPALWSEARAVCAGLKEESAIVLSRYTHNLGGGGCYPLLYFATRRLMPRIAVETGVAAGFSSHSILLAMQHNNGGKLYSSDFPYFRLKNAEQYIGVLVPEALRHRWTFLTEGDRQNIPQICSSLTAKIDLIHYDSDKTYEERAWTCRQLAERKSPDCLFIMDDIQDDLFFAELVGKSSDWAVFAFEGKYLGVVGLDALKRGAAGHD